MSKFLILHQGKAKRPILVNLALVRTVNILRSDGHRARLDFGSGKYLDVIETQAEIHARAS
jgi:hypothetical protein